MEAPNNSCLFPDHDHRRIAIISVGNTLRGDDGIASHLCNTLPTDILQKVCRIDLGPYTNLLEECLKGHEFAIVIDATRDGLEPGTVSMINMNCSSESLLRISASHGLSVIDELRLAAMRTVIPCAVIFFGIEVADANCGDSVSLELKEKLPKLSAKLTSLIENLLDAAPQPC